MLKKTAVLICVVMLGIVNNVWAADKVWTNGASDGLWKTTGNWSGGLPTNADKAKAVLVPGPTIDSSTAAVCCWLVVADTSSGALTMTGGTLNVAPAVSGDSWTIIAYGLSDVGTFTMSGGTVTTANRFFVGYQGQGTLNMNGGTMNIGGVFGIGYGETFTTGKGTVNLTAGTINVTSTSATNLNMNSNGLSRLEITGGILTLAGDRTSLISGYKTNGWIRGYGLASNVRYDYNITNAGKTTVWAIASNKATNPNPAISATDIARNVTLSWTGAAGATSHNIYFGTISPGTFQINQTGTTFNPGQLALNTTYYWRIDEISGPNTTTGDVWSFTTISGQAKTPDPSHGAANIALNKVLGWTAGAGAASHDVYFGTNSSDVNNASRLLGDLNGNGIADWIDLSQLTEYWLLDPTGTEPYVGINDDDIVDFYDYALLAEDWENSANPVFKGNQTAATYNPGTLALNTTYYWRIDEVNGIDTIKGNIWSFTTQSGKAFNPSPANSASGVATNATLSWSAGAGATSHNVYFGTTNSPTSIGNQAGTTYNPGTLANSTTYYWRIDEVSGSGTTTGDLWSFTTSGVVNANRRKGPYLIYPAVNTQMTVLWQVDITTGCSIAWGTDTNYLTGSANTTEYGTDHQHKYNITGLTPGTKYYYRVTIGSNNYTGSFTAAPAANATNLKFFMYGDTRSNGASHNLVAGRMVSTYTADPAYQTMVLHAGDWVNASTEADWTSQWYNYTWTNIVNTAASMPIMGAIGNHETGSIPIFQKYRPFPFVSATYFSFDYGPVHIAVVDQYQTYTNPSTQYTWLVNDLAASTKPWKIIVLHQPGWCAGGSHGNDTTVQTVIQPLCVTYGVQIVLAGHNHYYSRAVNSGVHHVTSGSGGAPLYSASAGQPYVVTYSTNVLECVKVEINGNTLTGTTVTDSGSVIDTFTVTLSKATNPSPANTAANVSVTPALSWTAGGGATSHNVYFGTTNPPPSIGNQTAATYIPGTLANSTTYFWRIDEVSGSGTAAGDLWSFTTAASGPEFTFVQASDPQIGWNQCGPAGSMDYLWGTTISKINNLNPDFVIVTGDLINTSSSTTQTATYKSYAAGINPLIPIYTVPGNHDIGDPSNSTKYDWWLSNLAYPTGLADPWYSFTYGDSIFIGLDSGVFKADWGGKQAAEIDWLTQTLTDANAAGYTHKFVFMHVALFVASADEAYNSAGNLPLAIRGQLLSLFHQYGVKVVMAGHRHTNNDAVDGDLQMFTTTSCTCGLGSPATPPGIRIFKVYSDHVEQEVRTLDSLP